MSLECGFGVAIPNGVNVEREGVDVADKSPSQHNTKKVGKSLKEKRNEKHAKKESKKGFRSE